MKKAIYKGMALVAAISFTGIVTVATSPASKVEASSSALSKTYKVGKTAHTKGFHLKLTV